MATIERVQPIAPVRPRTERRRSTGEWALRGATYGLIAFGAAVVLVPFFWMLSTSLKPESQLFVYPPQWLPDPPRPTNYREAWGALPFGRFLLNTVFMTTLAMFAELFTASIVAYGFARYRFPLRNTLFVVLLSTMMLPHILTLIPKFVMWR